MGVIADIERELARQRVRGARRRRARAAHEHDDACRLGAAARGCRQRERCSRGCTSGIRRGRSCSSRARAVATPSRPPRPCASSRCASLHREVISEVIEVRLRGRPAAHPASIVLPLLLSDLPAFCRWRGEPRWAGERVRRDPRRSSTGSSSTRRSGVRRPRGYERLGELFDRVAVSDLAYRRTLPWRVPTGRALARRSARVRRLQVTGPRADALLLAGWLRSRLRRRIALRVTPRDDA